MTPTIHDSSMLSHERKTQKASSEGSSKPDPQGLNPLFSLFTPLLNLAIFQYYCLFFSYGFAHCGAPFSYSRGV
jgi:hypothetical protein